MTDTAVPSSNPVDLLLNAQAIDQFANSPAATFSDRLGHERRTIAGIEGEFPSARGSMLSAAAYAAAAAGSAGGATASALAAAAARDVAQLSSGVYATTTAGLAAVASGRYFSVPSADVAEYLILYRNDAGTATEVKRYPSASVLDVVTKYGSVLIPPGADTPPGYRLTGAAIYGMAVAVPSKFTRLAGIFGASVGFAAFPADGVMYQDAGATTAAAADGDAVRIISDASPNVAAINAPADAQRPTLKVSGASKFLRFDGAANRLSVPSAAVNRSAFTLVCSVALRALGAFPCVLGDTSSSSGATAGFDSSGNPRCAVADGTAGLRVAVASAPVTLGQRVTLVYEFTGTDLIISLGATEIARTSWTPAGTAGAGTAAWLCNSGAGTSLSPIDLYGAVLIGRATTDDEKAVLRAMVSGDAGSREVSYIAAAVAAAQTADRAAAADYMAARYGISVAPAMTTGYAIGDSTVAEYLGGTALIDLVGTARQKQNLAVPGNTIAQQLAAWNAVSIAATDRIYVGWVVIQIGLNDMNPAVSIATTITELQGLVDAVRAKIGPSRPILLSKMLPCKQRFTDYYGSSGGPLAQAKWVALNDAIGGVANAGNGNAIITGVQARITAHVPLMDDGSGNLRADYDTGDHIHPNTAGRQVNANAWAAAITALGMTV